MSDSLHFEPSEFSHIVVDGPNAEETWTAQQWNEYIDYCNDPETGGEIIFRVVRLIPEQSSERPTLNAIYNADECTYDFEALRDYFRRAIPYALTHATGSTEGWRTASVEQLTEWMTDFLAAGITPTLSSEAVNSGVKVARQYLAAERAKSGAS